MSILSTKTDKIFFAKDCKYSYANKVDLILAPDFYWVRIFDIPVKNSTQAKNLLPTLFEDMLDTNITYSYKAIKLDDGRFLGFAYNNKEIFDAIKNSGLNINLINSVYFAQTELNEFENFNYKNQSYINTQENILVKLPNSLNQDFDNNLTDKLSNINLSSNKIDIKFYNNIVSSKQILILSSIILIFTLLNFINIIDYNLKINETSDKKDSYIKENSLPSSQLQLNSIVNGYSSSIDVEIKKREIYKFISDNKNFKIQSFSIKDKVVEFKVYNKSTLSKIQNFTKNYKSKIVPNTEYIDVRIEL